MRPGQAGELPVKIELATLGAPNGPDASAIADCPDLLSAAERAAETSIVLVVTRDKDQVAAVSALPGVLAFHLVSEAANRSLCDGGAVQIAHIEELACLSGPARAATVLQLSRMRPSDVRSLQRTRIEVLREAARAAGGLTIYGAGNIGRQAVDAARFAGLDVVRVLDANTARSGERLSGVEIGLPETLDAGRAVVVPALGRHIASVTANMRRLGAREIMSLSQLYALSRRPGEPETDYLDDLFANKHRYIALHLRLADARSRAVLDAILRHRLSLELEPLAEVCERDHPQWFHPDFLPRTAADVFVDGGAFDGDTAEGYIKARGPGYKRVHAFEIDPTIAEAARKRCAAHQNVVIHNVGLSDRPGSFGYRRTGGTDGSIGAAEGADTVVSTGRIDDHVPEAITFLKLDVEGEEAKAIAGARRQISENAPTLAIAVYHKAHDIWDLPRRILNLRPDYRLFLRHYTETAYESVIYALPGDSTGTRGVSK